MSARTDRLQLLEELHAFVSARLRDTITDPKTTPAEQAEARHAQKWYAASIPDARRYRTALGPGVDMLRKDARRWRKHPDYDPTWED